MENENCPYAFGIWGGLSGKRWLVENPRLTAYSFARCDDELCDTESYLSVFRYPSEFADYLALHGTTKGYDGSVGGEWLWIDIDNNELEQARKDAIALIENADRRYSVRFGDMLIFFSGSKGFHIGLPLSWSPEPSRDFNRVARSVAERLAGEVVIDKSIYDKVRAFRSPNSRHPKSGLHKIRLSYEELREWSIERIKREARRPRQFDYPIDCPIAEPLRMLWSEEASKPTAPSVKRTQHNEVGDKIDLPDRLNRQTIDFIRNGAGIGDRHRLLFRHRRI